MSTLFEISDEMVKLDALMDEREGDMDDPDVVKAIEAYLVAEGDFKAKVDSYCALMGILNARATARKAESDRLAKRAKLDKASADNLKNRLLCVFQMREISKMETDRFKVTVAKNGGALPVLVTDETAIPASFWSVKEVRTLDKGAIAKAIEMDGAEVPGAKLGDRGVQLNIR